MVPWTRHAAEVDFTDDAKVMIVTITNPGWMVQQFISGAFQGQSRRMYDSPVLS